MKQQNLTPLDNKLLASLPRELMAQLTPHLHVVTLAQGDVVIQAGERIEQVYFPLSGMFSMLAVMRTGKTIETATIGREGMVGGTAGLKSARSFQRVVVQLPSVAARIAAAPFRKIVAAHDALRHLCIDSGDALLMQASITAACNALHPVEARFARWLLQSASRADSGAISLTQEMLAEMLGVRRTSITEVAGRLQAQGMIAYSRGVIRIVDRPALEQAACECYRHLADHEAIEA